MTATKKIIIRLVAISVVLALFALPIVFFFVTTDAEPAVVSTAPVSTHVVTRVNHLMQKLKHDVVSQAKEKSITLTLEEINGLIAMAKRALPQLNGQAKMTPTNLEASFTLYTPQLPGRKHINLRFGIEPSSQGLNISYLSIGQMTFSGDTALAIATSLIDSATGDGLGQHLRQAIKSVALDQSKITFTYQPMPDLKQRLLLAKERAMNTQDELGLFADVKHVRRYYAKLCQTGKASRPTSLGSYLKTAFTLAQQQTAAGGNAVKENESALLALAIYLGSPRFEAVIGKVQTAELSHCRAYANNVKIARRNDLRLHFIYSAGLQVLSGSGISAALGEFKELKDSARGGSGFSFVDLAADRAGVRFAEVALDGKTGGAEKLQRMATTLANERRFFPDISGLKEGLSQADFDRHYGGIEGAAYKRIVVEIDARLKQMPLYNGVR